MRLHFEVVLVALLTLAAPVVAGDPGSFPNPFGVQLTALPDEPLFRVPVNRFAPRDGVPSPVLELPSALARFSDALRALQATGQDWAFAHVYSLVTAKELEFLAAGRFLRPDLVNLEVGQFYEVYASNANEWLAGREPEPAWAETARLSRELSLQQEELTGKDRNAAAIAVLLCSMYAHIVVDLPRCLMTIYYCNQPRPKLSEMKTDFLRMTPLFEQVSSTLLQEGSITPRVLARLPRFLRTAIATVGIGNVVRLMRRIAWQRFEWNAGLGRHRREILALPSSTTLVGLRPQELSE